MSDRTEETGQSGRAESLRRMLFREFLLEPQLYVEAGLDDLPEVLGRELKCVPAAAVETLLEDPGLESLGLDVLERLIEIRDMRLISCTAAAVSAELKGAAASYDHCLRVALCYAVAGMQAHTFSALRAAAAKHDDWARHHFLYGLMHGVEGNSARARWELEMALQREPYEEGRARIYRAIALFD